MGLPGEGRNRLGVVTETRDRFIASTLELFRRHGYNGTSLKQVTTAAGAPTGSLYHHFPGGKDDLTRVVLEIAGATYGELLEAIWLPDVHPVEGITTFFDAAADVLEETDFIDPCPIGTVAREVASTNDRLRDTANGVFDGWIARAEGRLIGSGLDTDAAAALALMLVAAIEGGFIIGRTARDGDVLRTLGRQVAATVDAALAHQRLRSTSS